MIKYTVEKVLYLANQEKPLNVSLQERSCTHLSERIKALIEAKMIYLETQDDSDKFYRTTKLGKIKLLKMQIEWRKKNKKDTDVHELELETLLSS